MLILGQFFLAFFLQNPKQSSLSTFQHLQSGTISETPNLSHFGNSDGWSIMISRLSLIFNTYFLFSWCKTLKLSKEHKKLQWGNWSQTALLFDGLIFFPVTGDRHMRLILSDTFITTELIAETTLKFIDNTVIFYLLLTAIVF